MASLAVPPEAPGAGRQVEGPVMRWRTCTARLGTRKAIETSDIGQKLPKTRRQPSEPLNTLVVLPRDVRRIRITIALNLRPAGGARQMNRFPCGSGRSAGRGPTG